MATLPLERAALAEIRSIDAERVALAVGFPKGFEPARSYPILVTQVTANHRRSNIEELARYAPTALELGYVVLTAQSVRWPARDEDDTIVHRYASLRAALRWLGREAPGSAGWPVVVAGFSGGAKISQALAFSLMLEQRRVLGVFLGGCNEDHSHVLLGEFPALRERFAQVAFFLSAGEQDAIAPPAAVGSVAQQLRASGARHVEVATHARGHYLDTQHLGRALRWFEKLSPARD